MSRKKTADLLGLLRQKVLGPEGQGAQAVFLEEVPDATGWKSSRRADAISIGMWPSRGCLVEAYELKVSRGDWLGELKDPSKAEVVARYCDRFWLVTLPGVVEVGELPGKWGLMVPAKNGCGLSILREPEPLEAEPIPAPFLASLLRRAVKADVNFEKRIAREEAERDATEKVERPLREAERRASLAEQNLESIRGVHLALEDRLGIPLSRFLRREAREVGIIGEVAKAFIEGEMDQLRGRLQDQLLTVDRVRDRLSDASTLLAWEKGGDPTD